MATDIQTPPKPAAAPVDPERPTSKVIPAVLLLLLLGGLAYGVYAAVRYVQTAEAAAGQEIKFVFRRLEESVKPLGDSKGVESPAARLGTYVLYAIPLLFLLMAYQSWRWLRAGHTLSWYWTSVLILFGLTSIYVLTALFFVYSGKGGIINPTFFWSVVLALFLFAGGAYVVWMYKQDAATVGWLWATFLGVLRCTVYLLLAGVFLLPALQTWDRTEQFSRVLILVDLSGSMNVSDEVTPDGQPGAARLSHVADLFAKDDGAFFKSIQKHNPVFVYGFGGTFDPESREFKKGEDATRWSKSDWLRWMRLDLRQWALDGLSDKAREKVSSDDAFKADKPALPEEWATEWFKNNQALLAQLDPADRMKLEDKGKNLQERIKLRYQIVSKTNYGDALLNVLGQEEKNMLAGVIVIGDGQSTEGSAMSFEEVQRKAQAAKAPIFVVGVGEERPKVAVRITDVQAPSRTPPSDAFVVRVEVDGEGLDKQKLPVFLDVFKADEKGVVDKQPVMTLPGEVEFKTVGGPIPHGQTEFKFDPEADNMGPLRRLLKEDDKKEAVKEFAVGEYRLVARVPKAKGEMFPGKEHVSDLPVSVQVVKRALRVLLVASGPGKDYQFCRRLFMNERAKGLAELCVFLQVSDPKGQRAQDVPENQRLLKFPDTFRVEEDPKERLEDKFYNLAKYDIILCFDPDWTKIDPADLAKLKKWVEIQGGGFVYVAGINTHKLTERALAKDLQPIIDLLPIVPDDDRRFSDLEKPTDKPFALKFPTSGDADFLKLDDMSDYALAGWSEFFYGKPRNEVDYAKDTPVKGFFRCYPSKSTKPTATVLATFPDKVVRDDGKVEDQPYVVTMPYPEGKVVYLAGEMRRLREAKNGEQLFDRFYTKLARYAGSNALKTESKSRGVLVMGRQFTSGKPMDVEAKLRAATITEPLPSSTDTFITLTRVDGEPGAKPERKKLQPKKEGKWDGWFALRFDAPAAGKYQLELQVPGSTEVLRQEFHVKEFNPELDNTRPDKNKLWAIASPVSELRLSDAGKRRQLDTLLGSVAKPEAGREGEGHLFFDLNNATHIPGFLSPRSESHSSKGPVEDLWSEGPTLGQTPDGKPRVVATVLMLIVGLLSLEWLTRKLLKLA